MQLDYVANVSDPTGHSQNFRIPVAVTDRELVILRAGTDISGIKRILKRVAHQAQDVILAAGPWRCVICPQTATRMIATAAFCPKPKTSNDPSFVDYTPFPICASPRCNNEATRQVHAITSDPILQQPRPEDGRPIVGGELLECANCGAAELKSGGKMMQCSGCKSFFYCCKECQVAHWKAGHKHHCERLDKKQKK